MANIQAPAGINLGLVENRLPRRGRVVRNNYTGPGAITYMPLPSPDATDSSGQPVLGSPFEPSLPVHLIPQIRKNILTGVPVRVTTQPQFLFLQEVPRSEWRSAYVNGFPGFYFPDGASSVITEELILRARPKEWMAMNQKKFGKKDVLPGPAICVLKFFKMSGAFEYDTDVPKFVEKFNTICHIAELRDTDSRAFYKILQVVNHTRQPPFYNNEVMEALTRFYFQDMGMEWLLVGQDRVVVNAERVVEDRKTIEEEVEEFDLAEESRKEHELEATTVERDLATLNGDPAHGTFHTHRFAEMVKEFYFPDIETYDITTDANGRDIYTKFTRNLSGSEEHIKITHRRGCRMYTRFTSGKDCDGWEYSGTVSIDSSTHTKSVEKPRVEVKADAAEKAKVVKKKKETAAEKEKRMAAMQKWASDSGRASKAAESKYYSPGPSTSTSVATTVDSPNVGANDKPLPADGSANTPTASNKHSTTESSINLSSLGPGDEPTFGTRCGSLHGALRRMSHSVRSMMTTATVRTKRSFAQVEKEKKEKEEEEKEAKKRRTGEGFEKLFEFLGTGTEISQDS